MVCDIFRLDLLNPMSDYCCALLGDVSLIVLHDKNICRGLHIKISHGTINVGIMSDGTINVGAVSDGTI